MPLPHGLRKTLVLTAAPAFDTGDADKCLVTRAQAKRQLRVDYSDEDDVIDRLIGTATAYLDGAGGILGRALLTQSWQLRLPGFQALEAPRFMVPGNILATGIVAAASGRLRVPLPPTATLDKIEYVDVNGVTQTLDASLYQVVPGGALGVTTVLPAYNQYWPPHRLQDDAVLVTFTAGYGKGGDVPAPIAHAALLMLTHWYEDRSAILVSSSSRAVAIPIPLAADALLAPYMASWF